MFLNLRDADGNWVIGPVPAPIFPMSTCAQGQFELFCACTHAVVGSSGHSLGAFWKGGSDDRFAAQPQTDLQGLPVAFGIVSESLADVTQPAAGSTRCEISTQINFTGPPAAEWT